MPPDRFHRLLGEQEGFQPDLRCTAHQRQRIRQREQDQIIFTTAAAFQKGAAVIDVAGDARIGVRPVGIPFGADLHDARIDIEIKKLAMQLEVCSRQQCPQALHMFKRALIAIFGAH